MKNLRPIPADQRKKPHSFKRGSALILTLFVVTSLSLAVGSLSQWSVNELMVNQRAMLRLDANNAAEAAAQYAMSNLKTRWDNQTYFPANQFVNNPVTLPTTISSYLWANTDINPGNIVIKTSQIPSSNPIYIDPNDPANAFDPQRGKSVTATDVYVYTSATASKSVGINTIRSTSYAEEALEVRNSPLFSHAIFYNMDLELHPGPSMTIVGPVYATGNIWACAQTGLTFSGPVTCTGNFNVGMEDWPTSWGSYNSGLVGSLIYLPNTAGGYTTPYKGSGSTTISTSYWDSRTTNFSGSPGGYTDWLDLSAHLWGGNLQTSANDVPVQTLTGYGPFVYMVGGTSQNLNYSYAMIEPNQFNPTTNSYHKGVGELDKFERQAGLIVKVHAAGTVNISGSATIAGNVTGSSSANMTAITTPINRAINSTIASWMTSSTGTFTPAAGVSVVSGSMVFNDGTTQSITTSGNLNKSSIPSIGTGNTAFLIVTQVSNSNTSTQASALTANTSSATAPCQLMYANSTGLWSRADTTNNTGTAWVNGSYNPVSVTTSANFTRTIGFAWVEVETLNTTVDSTTGLRTPVYNSSTSITDSSGDVIYPGDVIPQPIAVDSTQITGTYNGTNDTWSSGGVAQNMLQFSPYTGNLNTPTATDLWGGIYDGRRAQTAGAGNISTVTLDVGKLKALVDDNVAGQAANAALVFNNTSTGVQSYTPSQLYNGVVYVEFPQLAGNPSRLNSVTASGVTYPGDQITDSVQNMGLVLTDAKSTSLSTGVPNPSYNNPAVAGQAGRQQGFTVATNNCVYTDGNYNADGNLATPMADTAANQQYNSTMPDVPGNPDPACCIAADSITCLSGGWISRNSKASSPNTATATEVNAAFLTGIVPSNPATGSLSGGAHNFPRFLENWGSVDFRYRGSLVSLFASEIGSQPYTGSCYSPPNREWGFYNQFANGIYPPGSPNARTYYIRNFQLLTQAQYSAATAGL